MSHLSPYLFPLSSRPLLSPTSPSRAFLYQEKEKQSSASIPDSTPGHEPKSRDNGVERERERERDLKEMEGGIIKETDSLLLYLANDGIMQIKITLCGTIESGC